MANQSNILKDLGKYLPEVVIPTLIAFISVPVFTRLFDPAAYGNLNIARVTITLLERCSGWIGSSVTRYYNEYEKENNLHLLITTIVKTIIVISIIIIIAGFVVVTIIDVNIELKTLLKIGVILFGINLISSCLRNVIRLQRRIITHSIFVVTTSIFSFIISLILIIYLNINIESILIGYLVITILLLPFLWRVSAKDLFKLRLKVDTQIIKRFASYGIPLTVSFIGGWALDFSDRYIIKWQLGSYEVGVYSACYNITWNSLYLVVNLFYMMEEPLAMKVFVLEGKDALREFINQETRLYFIIIIPLVFMMCCYSEAILSIMVAKKYHAGKGIVPYIAISTFLAGLIFKYRLGIMAMEKTKSLMVIIVFAGILNVILNMMLVPGHGIIGAAVATLVAYFVYFLLMLVISSKIFPWRFPVKSFLRITLAAAASICPLSYLIGTESSIMLLSMYAMSSVGVYSILLFALNEVKPYEIKKLLTLLTSKLNMR